VLAQPSIRRARNLQKRRSPQVSPYRPGCLPSGTPAVRASQALPTAKLAEQRHLAGDQIVLARDQIVSAKCDADHIFNGRSSRRIGSRFGSGNYQPDYWGGPAQWVTYAGPNH
jgi:hypothetical protein